MPSSNVVPVNSALPWEELAAIPESYATAWTALDGNLAVAAGQTIVIRGATSALGQAAVNIAAQAGVRVIATTRNAARAAKLEKLGAKAAEMESPQLSAAHPRAHPARHRCGARDRRQQHAARFAVDGEAGAGGCASPGFSAAASPSPRSIRSRRCRAACSSASSAAPSSPASPQYPLSDIPFQTIVERAAAGVYPAKPARVFAFDQLHEKRTG